MTILSAIAIIRRFWPIGAALGVLLALWAWGNHREAQGVRQERAKWQQQEVAAKEAQRAREAALQAQVDAAGAALSMSTAEIERLSQRATGNVRSIYAARPDSNIACLAPDVLRAIADSDKAADNPSAASPSAH